MAERTLLFGYGSLVSRASAEETLAREISVIEPAVISGWRRRWSLLRDNRWCEKTFALADGTIPDWLLTLNVERTGDPADRVNGAVIEIGDEDLPALGVREVRYRLERARTEDGTEVAVYTAKHRNTALVPPEDAVILESYLHAVEAGFRELGRGQLAQFWATTGEPPVPVLKATLVRHAGERGSPVHW